MKSERIKIFYPKTIYSMNDKKDFFLLDSQDNTEFSFAPYTTALIDSYKNLIYLKKEKNPDDIEVDKEHIILYSDLSETDRQKLENIVQLTDQKYDELEVEN